MKLCGIHTYRAPFHLPKTNCARTPNHAPEFCLPAGSSTQADIISRSPASTDVACHIIYNHITINMYYECTNMSDA